MTKRTIYNFYMSLSQFDSVYLINELKNVLANHMVTHGYPNEICENDGEYIAIFDKAVILIAFDRNGLLVSRVFDKL